MRSIATCDARLIAVVTVYHDPARAPLARLDRSRLLERCLASLIVAADRVQLGRSAFREVGLLVVDDYSPVDPREAIDPVLLRRVQWLKNRGVKGQAGSLNFALASIDADVFAFTDSDCVVAPDWFETISDHYREHPDHGGVGGPNWLFSDISRWWPRVLTAQEAGLMRFLAAGEIDHVQHTFTRIDCRNLSIRADFAARLNASGPLFSEGNLSVSGQASYYLKSRLDTIDTRVGYCAAMRTYHEPVSSLRTQVALYYARGRQSRFAEIYALLYGGLWNAFVKRYGARHFVSPVVSRSVSFLYLWPVHAAFWAGILRRKLAENAARVS